MKCASALVLWLCLFETRVKGKSGGLVRDGKESDFSIEEVQFWGQKVDAEQEKGSDQTVPDLRTIFFPDILAELKELRDMVVEQRAELRSMDARLRENQNKVENQTIELTFTRKDVEQLQTANTALDSRLSSSELQLEKLTRANADQADELSYVKAELQLHNNKIARLEKENMEQASVMSTPEYRLETIENKLQDYNNSIIDLEQENAFQENELMFLKANQRTITTQVEDLQKENTKVAFHAALTDSGKVGPYYGDMILHFEKVIANIGQRYSPVTGCFVAPAKGIYFFRFTVCAEHSAGWMGVILYKNDQKIMWNEHRKYNSNWEYISNSVTLELREGDVVYMHLPKGQALFDNVNNQSTFSGFLLFLL